MAVLTAPQERCCQHRYTGRCRSTGRVYPGCPAGRPAGRMCTPYITPSRLGGPPPTSHLLGRPGPKGPGRTRRGAKAPLLPAPAGLKPGLRSPNPVSREHISFLGPGSNNTESKPDPHLRKGPGPGGPGPQHRGGAYPHPHMPAGLEAGRDNTEAAPAVTLTGRPGGRPAQHQGGATWLAVTPLQGRTRPRCGRVRSRIGAKAPILSGTRVLEQARGPSQKNNTESKPAQARRVKQHRIKARPSPKAAGPGGPAAQHQGGACHHLRGLTT